MRSTRILLSMVALAACGGDDDGTCELGESCSDGRVCEAVMGGEPACFAPIVVRGRVFDSIDGAGVADARIVALDANRTTRSDIAISAADGSYELPVSVTREPDGTPTAEQFTLRADAASYRPFPEAPRVAVSLDPSGAVDGELRDASTDIALLPRRETASGTVSGRVDHPDAGGTLVLAVRDDVAVSSAIAGRDGEFVLFDVPDGETRIAGYSAGLRIEAQTVNVTGAVRDVVLAATAEALATVSGSVQIVNAPGGSSTSVILVPESAFDPERANGDAPPGLRAAPVDGAFAIRGVAPGRYAVLAAFENDRLVRDPDESIGGTLIVYADVGEADVVLDASFKVTEALVVVAPGATGTSVVTEVPVLEWEDDSSEDGYELRVFDAYGDLVFEDLDVPRVTGGDTVQVTLVADLQVGGVYQFRALSFRESGGGRTYISATEDLLGVFRYQP